MKKFLIIVLVFLFSVAFSSCKSKSINSIGDIKTVSPFKVESNRLRVNFKGDGAVEASFEEDGKAFVQALNAIIDRLELADWNEPDINIYIDDTREVVFGYGIIRFIEGDNFTDYYLSETSDDFERAYRNLMENAKRQLDALYDTRSKLSSSN
jgi:hypothetical protein